MSAMWTKKIPNAVLHPFQRGHKSQQATLCKLHPAATYLESDFRIPGHAGADHVVAAVVGDAVLHAAQESVVLNLE